MKNSRLLYIAFGIYMLSILLFGYIYYFVYYMDEKSFIFNSDIENARIQILTQEHQNNKVEIIELLAILKNLKSGLKSGALEVKLKDDNSYRSETIWYVSMDGLIAQFHCNDEKDFNLSKFLIVGQDDANVVHHVTAPPLRFCGVNSDIDKMWLTYSDYLIEDQKSKLEAIQLYLDINDSPYARHWGIVDFVYFSAITQTTVGYGDILPNKTKVRAIIIMQILIGLIAIVIAGRSFSSKD